MQSPTSQRRGHADEGLCRHAGTPVDVQAYFIDPHSSREPPSDAEIERGLRERAVSDARAAEILLGWLQGPRAEERVGGVNLDSLSERKLERLYSGLLKPRRMLEGGDAALQNVGDSQKEQLPGAGVTSIRRVASFWMS